MIGWIFTVVYGLLVVYLLVLWARLILSYIPLFNRGWRPKGAGLVLAEIVYTVTDPPIKFLRRFIPPLRLGQVSIDFSFMLVMFACIILMSITSVLSRT
ncbi:YggT family protein [Microbacterium sp. JB110]|uniref:YggT family protein n=1 Tax=unclassified Microbacterium TaxID=2609290 RepID=UPI00097EF9F0|nr:Possible membrane protein [Frigoribacterium sp. JB110]